MQCYGWYSGTAYLQWCCLVRVVVCGGLGWVTVLLAVQLTVHHGTTGSHCTTMWCCDGVTKARGEENDHHYINCLLNLSEIRIKEEYKVEKKI